MGEENKLIDMEQVLFDLKLPDSMPGDPGHPDRYKCHGCDRIMDLIRVNDRVAFYTHQCEMLDDLRSIFPKELISLVAGYGELFFWEDPQFRGAAHFFEGLETL